MARCRTYSKERAVRRTRLHRSSLVVVAGMLAVAGACGGQDVAPDGDATDDAVDDATDDVDDTVDDVTDDVTDDADDTVDDATDDATDDGPDEGPQPDPDLVADPCDPHQGREGEAFIDLVAPVDDQQAGGEVDIVGCSNVFEATVSYRVLDGDGRTLSEGFTTAECGSGCVGVFRDTIDLAVAEGEPVAYIQVFWESAEDGSDQDLTERIVVLTQP